MGHRAESKIVEEVLTANARYAQEFGDKSKLALPPARRFAVLTCMDARIRRGRSACARVMRM